MSTELNKIFKINIIDTAGSECVFKYKLNEYNNLMEFIFNEMSEYIGDCKGRTWCGTCGVILISGYFLEQREQDEQLLIQDSNLRKIEFLRLSCQINLDEKLNNTTWRILDSRNLY